jgi:cell division protein FtsL
VPSVEKEETAAPARRKSRLSGVIRGGRDLVLAIAMVVAVLLLSGVLNLNQTALQSQLRFGISEMETECLKLDQANAGLSMQLAPLSALTAIQVRASKAGLGPPKTIEYLDVPVYTPATPTPHR